MTKQLLVIMAVPALVAVGCSTSTASTKSAGSDSEVASSISMSPADMLSELSSIQVGGKTLSLSEVQEQAATVPMAQWASQNLSGIAGTTLKSGGVSITVTDSMVKNWQNSNIALAHSYSTLGDVWAHQGGVSAVVTAASLQRALVVTQKVLAGGNSLGLADQPAGDDCNSVSWTQYAKKTACLLKQGVAAITDCDNLSTAMQAGQGGTQLGATLNHGKLHKWATTISITTSTAYSILGCEQQKQEQQHQQMMNAANQQQGTLTGEDPSSAAAGNNGATGGVDPNIPSS